MSDEIIENLGPLAPLAGIWEGDKGIGVSRIHSKETETKFREKIVIEPLGPVNNGPQKLYGLRYSTTVWRLAEDEPFHEELGYWLWDKDRKQVLRCFMVPRVCWLMRVVMQKSTVKNFICRQKSDQRHTGYCRINSWMKRTKLKSISWMSLSMMIISSAIRKIPSCGYPSIRLSFIIPTKIN